MFKGIIVFFTFSLAAIRLCAVDILLDTQYVVIEVLDTYSIMLGSNFSYIKAIFDKDLNPPRYTGESYNSLTITANSPVLLKVSLMEHTLSQHDKLDLTMSPPNNGLARSVTLWNGKEESTNEQLAQNIEGEAVDFRLKLTYFGDAKTSHDMKDAWLFFTIYADDMDI